jgi:ribosome-binding ATPase YchF (GTP1/OBG family)
MTAMRDKNKTLNCLAINIFGLDLHPAYLNVVDIAGLVKGAAEGQGLGNAFLSHISACDGIFHLCREYFFGMGIDDGWVGSR